MKNPLSQFLHCWRWWRSLQSEGFFSWEDATKQIDRVILPSRFAFKKAGEKLGRQTRITSINETTSKIEILEQDLLFYWHGQVDNNLYFLIEQEFDQENPHCYTTPPIQLSPKSLVIDVGACEGLFAYRLLKQRQCGRVICFEPLVSMAKLVERGAIENGITDGLTVESLAVSDVSGPVRLVATDNPDACHIETCSPNSPDADAQAIRLDEYLDTNHISLNQHDLIKVDAEGADLSVIEGAAKTIARDHPQIAITTYHDDTHVKAISERLRELNPSYQFRLKGFSHWTTRPRPVLLQASSVGE
jgi:FkbM family methyltransferase